MFRFLSFLDIPSKTIAMGLSGSIRSQATYVITCVIFRFQNTRCCKLKFAVFDSIPFLICAVSPFFHGIYTLRITVTIANILSVCTIQSVLTRSLSDHPSVMPLFICHVSPNQPVTMAVSLHESVICLSSLGCRSRSMENFRPRRLHAVNRPKPRVLKDQSHVC